MKQPHTQPLRIDNQANPYDVIVCGAGHAGCEAALSGARMGADTLILTGNVDTVAQMSCNPAIGGLAKGHIVREIDALGGAMGLNADMTGIQYRLLNASKGPAVQAGRTQCDKKAYQYRMKHLLELYPGLTLFQAMVNELIVEDGKVVGVQTNLGHAFYAHTVIVTTGTFLRGLMHIGENKNEGGRLGDFTAKGLSASFIKYGIELQRLKTGTPARILGSTIDFSQCEEQPGDKNPALFAFYDTYENPEKEMFHVEQSGQEKLGWRPGTNQVSCWVTSTTEATQQLVNDNLHRSPLYSGKIKGTGARYCPSIEDKYVKFAEKATHRIFLEPEGRSTNEWYLNGLSTSLPLEIQLKMLRSVVGLENVLILRPAYAVEYDFAPPTQLFPTLESKKIENLFFAGQINGTSGYEEAACQGLVAGVNAVLKVRQEEPFIIRRHEGYTGVLIDDLVTKGTQEPYRMFTSRAEHRLLFNHGSAELRLLPHLERLPLVSPGRLENIRKKKQTIDNTIRRLETEKTKGGPWAETIRRLPFDDSYTGFPEDFHTLNPALQEQISYRVRYKGYLDREERILAKMQSLDNIRIPDHFDFAQVKGLRNESLEKLLQVQPRTLGQANRISGVNPADISLLMVALRVI